MLSEEELSAQLEATKLQLEEITAEVARNEDKMRRSQRRELGLLQAEDLKSLFHELTAGLRKSYELQYVSIVLCDPDHDIRHLLLAAGSPVRDIDNLIMVESMTGLAPQYLALRRPWLGPYVALRPSIDLLRFREHQKRCDDPVAASSQSHWQHQFWQR